MDVHWRPRSSTHVLSEPNGVGAWLLFQRR